MSPVTVEGAVGVGGLGGDDPLGEPLVVEVGYILDQLKVPQQSGRADAGGDRTRVIGDRDARVGGLGGALAHNLPLPNPSLLPWHRGWLDYKKHLRIYPMNYLELCD